MKIKFENFSVSGIFREYAGFALNLPGHSIADKAVIADVPDELVEDVTRFLAANHPAVAIEENPAEEAGFEVAEADRLAAEKAAEEAKEIEAAELAAAEAKAKEEADQAEADRVAAEKAAAPAGGKKK